MARQWRIEYKGAYYHVMSRGIDGRDIASNNMDRELFVTVLEEMSDRFTIKIHAWVLMDNHYHLLIETPGANLSKSMQWFGVTFTKRYNVLHKRWGHLFQGRFKSILVQDDAYMFRLSCYIHRNPLRAGIVSSLADYEWSSYRAYAYGDPLPPWLTTSLILSKMDQNDPHVDYRNKVQAYSGEKEKLAKDIHLGIAVGTVAFAKQVKRKYLLNTPHSEIPQQKLTKDDYDVPALLETASKTLGCNLAAFKKAARIDGADKIHRDLLVYLFWETGAFTNKQIGQYLGLTYSSVSHCIKSAKAMLKDNCEFRAWS